jgi:hypothetical protein
MSLPIGRYTSSRLGRSIVTAVATAQTNATQTTTPFGAQTYQVRVTHSFANGIWFVVGNSTTAALGATSAAAGVDNYMPNNWLDYYSCTPGQALAFISTSTTTGYVSVTEMS